MNHPKFAGPIVGLCFYNEPMQSFLRQLCAPRSSAALLALVFCLSAGLADGQSRSATDGGPLPDPVAHPTYDGSIDAPLPPGVMERATQAFIAERRQKVTRDAQRLVMLTQDLVIDMRKSDQSLLSADLIKRITRIQKLAQRVKNRVKDN